MKRVRFLLHSNAYKFGTRLKELREEKNLTQKDFSADFIIHNPKNPEEEVSVTLDTIQNWEQHYNLPDVDTLLDLADYFGVNVDYLLGRIDRKTHEIDDISELTLLSPKAVETILDNKIVHHFSPPTIEEKKELDQSVADGKILGYDPLPEDHVERDRRNVWFLDALITSEEFKSLFANFDIYRSNCSMHNSFYNEAQEMEKVYRFLSDDQKEEVNKLHRESEHHKYKANYAKDILVKCFDSFLNKYEHETFYE